jgi:hypothetical protein
MHGMGALDHLPFKASVAMSVKWGSSSFSQDHGKELRSVGLRKKKAKACSFSPKLHSSSAGTAILGLSLLVGGPWSCQP